MQSNQGTKARHALAAAVNMAQDRGNKYVQCIPQDAADVIEQRDTLLKALEEAVKCGMVPKSSVKDGGATRHARQVVVADMIRDAIKLAKGP